MIIVNRKEESNLVQV